MSSAPGDRDPAAEPVPHDAAGADEAPESLPPKAWVTLLLFAAFVVAFGTCASTYMFN